MPAPDRWGLVWGRIAVAVAAAGVLGGCAGPSSVEPAGTNPVAGPVVAGRPFSGLNTLSEEQLRQIHDASERAVVACMAERGFSYTAVAYSSEEPVRIRLEDVAYAREWGFGLTEGGQQPPQGSGAESSPSYLEALIGESVEPESATESTVVIDGLRDGSTLFFQADSCASIGLAAAYGDLKEWVQAETWVEEISNEVMAAVEADHRWRDRQEEWAQCMVDGGFGEGSRQERIKRLLTRANQEGWEDPELVEQEIPVAVAGAECETSLGMKKLFATLQGEHEDRIGAENEGVLMSFLEIRQQAAVRAEELAQGR
ncbi:MAG: hypothetical protein ACK5LN_02010 [Propioniciclava sp.]